MHTSAMKKVNAICHYLSILAFVLRSSVLKKNRQISTKIIRYTTTNNRQVVQSFGSSFPSMLCAAPDVNRVVAEVVLDPPGVCDTEWWSWLIEQVSIPQFNIHDYVYSNRPPLPIHYQFRKKTSHPCRKGKPVSHTVAPPGWTFLAYFGYFSWKVGVPSPKIEVKIPCTNEKLRCKGEPYWFSGQRDPLMQTQILSLYYTNYRILCAKRMLLSHVCIVKAISSY